MPIAFERVTYSYDADPARPALDDVTFSVADGEFVCIVGHTGSGKSTLAEHVNGIKLPASGRVVVNGIDTSDRRRRRELRRLVGYVMQYPEYQLFAETVADDVAFGPRNMGAAADEAAVSAREALGLVGLSFEEVAGLSPFDLSGGQRRRVALAGTLAIRPRILVVDEPMAGLDPRGRREVLDIVRGLHARGATVVMVSHSMDDVAEVAQRIIVLDRGRVACEGTPQEVFAQKDVLRRAGLDLPQAALMARRLEGRGFSFGAETPLTLERLARAVADELVGSQGLSGKGGGSR